MTRQDVFEALAALLRPYANRLCVKVDDGEQLYLEENVSCGDQRMFAAVQTKASYISLHVYPIYVQPSLLEGASETLRKQMHGKSCFNFKTLDQVPKREIAKLLRVAYASLSRPR